jgi:hypothetical protein
MALCFALQIQGGESFARLTACRNFHDDILVAKLLAR